MYWCYIAPYVIFSALKYYFPVFNYLSVFQYLPNDYDYQNNISKELWLSKGQSQKSYEMIKNNLKD